VVAISTDTVVDFKRQITDLLIKVKLTRQTIKDTLNDIKKLRIEESSKTLNTLSVSICEDLRTTIQTQRRHVLSSLLQRAVQEVGPNEMKVIFERDLVPHLTEKERRTTTRPRVK
jgi:F0F1-type ATP synthase membrane subunit b/b'